MKKIDLHIHTTASDGIYAPTDLVNFAQKNGLSALAVTDHDTVDGLDEAAAAAEKTGISFIPGIEFSVDYHGGSFHLLGYYMEYHNRELKSELKWLTDMRDKRAERIVEDLNSHGIRISYEDVIEEAGSVSSIGRPHIARVLVRNNYASDVKDVFQNFLVKGKPGYIRKDKISVDRAFELIKITRGLAVLAHPYSLEIDSAENFEKFLIDMMDKGLRGIEAYSSMHDADLIRYYIAMADKYGLLITGGSDFHGDKNETIGYYSSENAIPPELFESLQDFHYSRAHR